MKVLNFLRSLLFICVLFFFGMSCYAQQEEDPVFKLNNVPVPYGVYPCMADTDTLVLSLVDDFQPTIINSWTASGDLQLSVLTPDKRSVRIVSTGPARGAATINYNREGCGSSSERLIINKSFAPSKYNLSIEGPECIVSGQTVVYSVDPILTKHLSAQIGIDTYHWNVIEQQENLPFVDEVLYVSGDGSSVTFSVGEINQESLPTITLNVGDCNQSSERTLSLNLGNATPKPDVPDTVLVPYGTAPFVVKLNESNPDIAYTWECSQPISFDLSLFDSQDSIRLTPQESAKSADCKIYVTGEYRNITCNTSSDTIQVIRSWGESVTLKAQDDETCFMIGNQYKFSVSGDVPPSSKCKWTIPQGWSLVGDNDTAQYIYLTPTSPAKLRDTLWVRPRNARDTASARFYAVRVTPAPITHINTPGCIAVNGGVNKCYIDTTGLKPSALSFEWDIPADSIVRGQGTDTIYFKGGYDISSIGVTSIGKDGCNGETYTQSLPLPPVAPERIESSNTCLWADSIQQVTLSVSNPELGQHYAWSVPNWNPQYNSDSSSVTLTTNGIRGSYPVSVWAVGSGECPQSTTANYTVVIDTMDWSIGYSYLEEDDAYRFALYKNGVSNPIKVRAYWYVEGELQSISRTLTTIFYLTNEHPDIPQYVTAVIQIDGCDINVNWSAPSSIPERKINSSHKENTNIKMKITPNPIQSVASIDLEEVEEAELVIYDISGEIIQNLKIYEGRSTIDTSSFPDGYYYFVAKREKERSVKKILIKH